MEGRSEPQSLTPDPLDPLDPVDPVDPLVNSEWRVLGMKNNENDKCHSKISILQCFLLVCVIEFSFSLCFTMNLDAEFSKR